MTLEYTAKVKGVNQIFHLFNGVNKTNKKVKDLNKSIINVNKTLSNNNKGAEKLAKTFANKVGAGDVFNKFSKVKNLFSKMSEKTNEFKNGISGAFKAFSGSLKNGIGFTKALKNAFVGFSTKAPQLLGAIITKMSTLTAAFTGFLLPLAAIITTFLILKRMFTLNVGGMTTTWNKFVGKAQKIWAKLSVAFNKTLRALGPLFKVIFGIISGIFDGLLITIEPIIDIISEIGKLFEEIFPVQKGKHMINIGKVIGGIFKVIGHILALPLKLIALIIKAITFLVKGVIKVFTAFNNFRKSNKILNTMLKFLFPIIALLDAMPKLIEKIQNAWASFKGIFKSDNAISTSGLSNNKTTNNRTTNNNNNITINSSRRIDENEASNFANLFVNQIVRG